MSSLWMLVAGLLFACMGVCVKLGASLFSAGELVFWRGFIALLVIAGYVLASGRPLRTAHWRSHIYRSISGFTALALFFFAITTIPLATAVTLNYTSPLFLALLLVFWVGERPRPLLILALVLGFAGVAVLLQPTFHRDETAGALSALFSAGFVGVAYYQLRELGALGEPEWRTVFYFSLVTTLGGLVLMVGSGFHGANLHGALLLLGTGAFGVLAQLALTRAYKHGKTLVTASLAYSTVLFSSLFGVLLWHDAMPTTSWLAIGLIILSGVLASACRGQPANPVLTAE
jgi:drug/metabolite transporter (DMT)-like permease